MMDESTKATKVAELATLSDYVNEMQGWLRQVGIKADTLPAKINSIFDLLIEKGLLTEEDVLDSEIKFTKRVIQETEQMVSQVRMQAMARGMQVPPLQTKSGIIRPGNN